MKTILLTVLLLGLAAGVASAQYHEPIYLYGGYYPTTSTLYNKGLLLLDATASPPRTTTVLMPGYITRRVRMDWDNRHLVIAVGGTTSTYYTGLKGGLFRIDHAGQVVKSLYHFPGSSTVGYDSPYDMVIDHNGDYIASMYRYRRSPYSYGYEIWKVRSDGTVSTLLTSVKAGLNSWYPSRRMRINIDTGKVLFNDGYHSSPTTMRYPVFEVDSETGTFSTWNTGAAYAWTSSYSMPQDHRTGYLQKVYSRYVLQLKPGTSGATTLKTLSVPHNNYIYYGGMMDLQTAARPRFVYATYGSYGGARTWLHYVDRTTWAVTSTPVSSLYTYSYAGNAFYRGRHTQTVRTVGRQWTVRLSAPKFPGMRYVVAAGFSGVRPGVTLPDQRRLNLNIDPLVVLTLGNRIPSVWNPGPGILDANGEAQGTLNLNAFAPAGRPIWIAWMVLDPKAPLGIAYMPDTYVMRI